MSISTSRVTGGFHEVPEGITNPPIDELLDKVESKYALVIYAAKRARQIKAYYSPLGQGLSRSAARVRGPAVPTPRAGEAAIGGSPRGQPGSADLRAGRGLARPAMAADPG